MPQTEQHNRYKGGETVIWDKARAIAKDGVTIRYNVLETDTLL